MQVAWVNTYYPFMNICRLLGVRALVAGFSRVVVCPSFHMPHVPLLMIRFSLTHLVSSWILFCGPLCEAAYQVQMKLKYLLSRAICILHKHVQAHTPNWCSPSSKYSFFLAHVYLVSPHIIRKPESFIREILNQYAKGDVFPSAVFPVYLG